MRVSAVRPSRFVLLVCAAFLVPYLCPADPPRPHLSPPPALPRSEERKLWQVRNKGSARAPQPHRSPAPQPRTAPQGPHGSEGTAGRVGSADPPATSGRPDGTGASAPHRRASRTAVPVKRIALRPCLSTRIKIFKPRYTAALFITVCRPRGYLPLMNY